MQLWLIPALPLAGFLINGIFGRRFSKSLVNTVAIGSVLLSFAWVLKTLLGAGRSRTRRTSSTTSPGSKAATLNIGCDFSVDRLTAVMLLVVTGIGSLIHIYSTGYMAHEGGYYRFFAYLNLFMFFMLMLVLAANYLLLFVGWEGVGLCSYLLIGFYFDKKFATNAGNKAFIVNRIGDFGFSLAMFLIFTQFRLARFRHGASSRRRAQPEELLTTIGLLLLVGACGKSAQIPLYVWLPDAMAGPTPVSALIHAATMVTAGVYMIARSCADLSRTRPARWNVIAVIGLATAVFAATIGLAQNDIKKVFAYSTVSQLGYMFLGVGVRRVFGRHLPPGDARVLQGAAVPRRGQRDPRALRRAGHAQHGRPAEEDPVTFWTMMCAAVAIAGVPPFSGFFSKDAILLAAYHHAPWMYWVGVDHRRHDRVLRLPRHVHDVLRRVSRPRSIRTNRRR